MCTSFCLLVLFDDKVQLFNSLMSSQARLPERESQHAGELERVGREHRAALRTAAESAEAASAALRADLDEERGALFAERDAAVEKNRNYYQGSEDLQILINQPIKESLYRSV